MDCHTTATRPLRAAGGDKNEMTMTIFETILTILGSNVVVAVFGYITGVRKSKAETDNTILAGLEQSISIYRDIITDLKTEIESLSRKIQELEAKVEQLHNENKKLKSNL